LAESYAEQNRENAGRRSRESYARLAEIGPLPAVVNPERKDACRTDLERFLVEYFPNSTGLKPFSEDHRRMIARLQRCILFGGMMIQAVYRGFAKTTVGERACIWAGVYGHRKFIVLVGADKEAASANLESIKLELSGNDRLYEDFPESCHPIRALEGRSQRAATQTLDGETTQIGWTADGVVLPAVKGADSYGVCIRPQSLMAFSRGMKHSLPDGTQVRPDFIFGDDLQTDESAANPSQVQKRLNKLNRSVLMSAGHGGSLAVYVAATIIEKDDAVDQLMDPERSPDWHGERVPMVKQWSERHEDFWLGEYADVRRNWDRSIPDDKQRARRDAMLLYESRREEADAGAVVSWEHCYKVAETEYEISAIQHAYNILIDRGQEVFEAECQNQPPDRMKIGADAVEPDDVLAKAVGPKQGVVPAWANRLTAFIDVQGNMLWYVVAAWADDFTGAVVDYGAWPEQSRSYFTKSDIKRTISDLMPGAGPEAQLRSALDGLTGRIMGSTWRREDSAEMSVELCLVDEGFQTPVIYEFCRRSTHASRIMPAKGMAIGASNKPFEEYQKRSGETLGTHWRRVKVGGDSIRHIIHNPNHWKSFIWNRIRVPVGDPGSLILHAGTSTQHRMLADHIASSEYPDRKTSEAHGRTVEEWRQIPNRDNDLFDCLCGAAIAASVLGCDLTTGKASDRRKPRKRRATGAWAA
jgi:hypothetical protein